MGAWAAPAAGEFPVRASRLHAICLPPLNPADRLMACLPAARPPHALPACRYKYMHGTDGDFHNPFDKGWRRNCGDTCKPQGGATAPYVLRCAGGAAAGGT